jgi:prefoldin beta subunit
MDKQNLDQNNLLQKIQELQILRQNLQALVMEEQLITQNLNEIEEALSEVEASEGKLFKLIGEVFVEKNKDDLLNELNSRKEILEIKLESLEKQKEKIKEKIEQLQKEIEEVTKGLNKSIKVNGAQ